MSTEEERDFVRESREHNQNYKNMVIRDIPRDWWVAVKMAVLRERVTVGEWLLDMLEETLIRRGLIAPEQEDER
jgi:hypothetical protein